MAKEEIGVEIPLGTRRSEPGIDKYADLSDQEMADILSGDKPDPTVVVEEEVVEPDDFDDKPEADAEEKPEVEEEADEADEDEEDEKEEAEVEDKSDDKDEEEDPLSKRIALLERRLELEALERVRETEARKRAELLASKQAGRAGFLQQQLKQTAKAAPAKSEDADASDDPWAEDASQSPAVEQDAPQSVPAQGMDEEARVELVKMAVNDEGNQFANEHAGALEGMPEKFILRLQELMSEEAEPYAEEFKSGSLKAVRKLARSCMTSALAAARIEFADTLKQEATTRKADSVDKSRRRKKKAAISATGKRTAVPKPKSTSYEDMSIEELEAEMLKEFGDNYRLGARRGL